MWALGRRTSRQCAAPPNGGRAPPSSSSSQLPSSPRVPSSLSSITSLIFNSLLVYPSSFLLSPRSSPLLPIISLLLSTSSPRLESYSTCRDTIHGTFSIHLQILYDCRTALGQTGRTISSLFSLLSIPPLFFSIYLLLFSLLFVSFYHSR